MFSETAKRGLERLQLARRMKEGLIRSFVDEVSGGRNVFGRDRGEIRIIGLILSAVPLQIMVSEILTIVSFTIPIFIREKLRLIRTSWNIVKNEREREREKGGGKKAIS